MVKSGMLFDVLFICLDDEYYTYDIESEFFKELFSILETKNIYKRSKTNIVKLFTYDRNSFTYALKNMHVLNMNLNRVKR